MSHKSVNASHAGSPALLYVRVSSKEQEKEGFSLDAQQKLGLDYAKRKGLEIVKTWKVSESALNSTISKSAGVRKKAFGNFTLLRPFVQWLPREGSATTLGRSLVA